MVPSPGRERTTLAAGCCSKPASSSVASSAIWAIIVAMTATDASTDAPMAVATTADLGAGVHAVPSWISAGSLVDPTLPTTTAKRAGDLRERQRVPRLGVGAILSTSSASALARSSKATRPPGRTREASSAARWSGGLSTRSSTGALWRGPSPLRPPRSHRRPGGGCAGRCAPCRPAPWRHRGRTSLPSSSGGPDSARSTSGSPRTRGSRQRRARRRTGPGRSRSR